MFIMSENRSYRNNNNFIKRPKCDSAEIEKKMSQSLDQANRNHF